MLEIDELGDPADRNLLHPVLLLPMAIELLGSTPLLLDR